MYCCVHIHPFLSSFPLSLFLSPSAFFFKSHHTKIRRVLCCCCCCRSLTLHIKLLYIYIILQQQQLATTTRATKISSASLQLKSSWEKSRRILNFEFWIFYTHHIYISKSVGIIFDFFLFFFWIVTDVCFVVVDLCWILLTHSSVKRNRISEKT